MSIARQRRRPPSVGRSASRTLLLATDLAQSVLSDLRAQKLNHHAYTPYGFHSGPQAAGPHLGFNGQLREPTGWYHLGNGHRVYNPVLMRFHSPDRLSPFGKGGLNAYAYCGADPINYQDPTGKFSVAIARLAQLIETTFLHAGIIAANAVGPVARGWQLVAARVSTVGSLTAISGSVLQLAGVSAGAVVSNLGTGLSVLAVFVRTFSAISNHLRAQTLWQTVKENVTNLTRGTAFQRAAPPDIEMGVQRPSSFPPGRLTSLEPDPSPAVQGAEIRQGVER